MIWRIALIAGLLFTGPASAEITGPLSSGPGFKITGTVGNGTVAPSFTGLIDIVASPTALYSLRAGSAAIAAAATQKLINIRNTATSETCDVIVATNGGFGNVANCSGASSGDTVAVFCAESSGTCAVTEAYDQTGNGNQATQATAADQPALTLSCSGALPCMTFAGSPQVLIANITSVAQPTSYSVVTARTSNFTSFEELVGTNGQQRVGWSATSGDGEIYAGTAVDEPASNTAIHNFQVVFSGSSSVFTVDATQTGSLNPNTAASGTTLGIGANSGAFQYLTGTVFEAGLWQNTTFTGTQMTNLCHNQYTYWGTSTSC